LKGNQLPEDTVLLQHGTVALESNYRGVPGIRRDSAVSELF